MNLEKIKLELENNGFFAGIKNDYIFGGFFVEEDQITGIITLSSGFRIYLDEKIKVEYSYGQITREVFFDEIKGLIEYLLNTFPLKDE